MVKLFNEIKKKVLTQEQRDNFSEKTFGIPELRKYPLNDAQHVRSAVVMFNYVSPKYEAELARNIKRAMKKFNVQMNVSGQNRLSKYMNNGESAE